MIDKTDKTIQKPTPKATHDAASSNPSFTRITEFLETYDYIFRVCLLGDSGVGKTSLLTRYCDLAFKDKYNTTIGVDFRVLTLKYQNIVCKIHIWDTAGQERFRALAINYFRTSNGFMFVYDITSEKSFDNITQWVDVAFSNSKEAHVNFLIGNKSDKESDRMVSKEKGEAFAKQHNFIFFETSASTSTNVDKAFELMAFHLIKYFDAFNRKDNDEEIIQLDKKTKGETIPVIHTKKCC